MKPRQLTGLLGLAVGAACIASLSFQGCVSKPPPAPQTYELPPSPPFRGWRGEDLGEWPTVAQSPAFDIKAYPAIPVLVENAPPANATAAKKNENTREWEPKWRFYPVTLDIMDDAVKNALLRRKFITLDRANVKAIAEEMNFVASSVTKEDAAKFSQRIGANCLLLVNWLANDAAYEATKWHVSDNGLGHYEEKGSIVEKRLPKFSIELLDLKTLETVWMAQGYNFVDVIEKFPNADGLPRP